MVSRLLFQSVRAGLGGLALFLLVVALVYYIQAGLETALVLIGGALLGALMSLLVLGATAAFNPLCQDRCIVAAASFFIMAGVLVSLSFVFWPAAPDPLEAALSSGLGVGASIGAWVASLRAAGRVLQRQESHTA